MTGFLSFPRENIIMVAVCGGFSHNKLIGEVENKMITELKTSLLVKQQNRSCIGVRGTYELNDE